MLRIPTATYRIQFNRDFRFSDARDLVSYLHDLGISDLYASPRFKAKKGSSHGYDVADPQRVSSELGSDEEFDQLVQRLKDYGMGHLLDIVPNHMSASHENPWWMDVLEHGPSSPFAGYFDIDWHPATTKAAFLQENKVLLPILGDLYGEVLENQELSLRLEEKGFLIRYYEHRLPLDPKSYAFILEPAGARLAAAPTVERLRPQLAAILEAIDRLPPYMTQLPSEQDLRQRESRAVKERIWRLYQDEPDFRRELDEVMLHLNGTRDDPTSFNNLDRLLSVQPYRLAHWKIGLEEINYRRFFDINELVGLRVEDPRVFEDRHRVTLQLVREGKVTGLRVDHIDGLRDPLGYLRLLQSSIGDGVDGSKQNLYVVVEKILGEHETLPQEWPVAGTTGYDFLNALNAVFIDPAGFAQLEAIYSRFTGSNLPFAEVCYAGNKKVMEQLFAGEVQALSHHLGKLAAQNRRARDLPLYEIVQLLVEVTACLPVYRTYVRDLSVAARDSAYIERTLETARKRRVPSRVSDAALGFLHRVLLLDPPFYAPQQKEDFLQFMMRWQQFSGPVMAKGLEDTASYIHNSLLSLNEVGSDPLRENLPFDVETLHKFLGARQALTPATMNATSTHDTKRGEDARARINVLSELADEWEACLLRWSRWNQRSRHRVDGVPVPGPAEEVRIYQALLGSWPLDQAELAEFPDRLKAFLVKAVREAKVHTSWVDPNPRYEAALQSYVDAILAGAPRNRFLSDFRKFQKPVAFYGALNSLSQVALKATAPGVPDFYQGCELWNFSMVDPDNRRPVDFTRRAQILEALKHSAARDLSALVQDLLAHWPDGRLKMFLTWRALAFRRENQELFARGEYLPLRAAGKKNGHLCAFARHHARKWAITAVPRLLTRLANSGQYPLGKSAWGSVEMQLPREAPGEWRNTLTGETLRARAAGGQMALRLEQVFRSFPVAILTHDAG